MKFESHLYRIYLFSSLIASLQISVTPSPERQVALRFHCLKLACRERSVTRPPHVLETVADIWLRDRSLSSMPLIQALRDSQILK